MNPVNNEMKKTYRDVYPQNPMGKPKVALDKAHSPYKILSHPQLVRQFIEGKPFHPIHLRIGITSACNMRCKFCNFHSPNEANFYDCFSYEDEISTERCISFLKEFAGNGGRAVTFCGSGECTVHGGYVDICRASHAAGLHIGLITNGSMLHHEKIAGCVCETHSWVRIGLNAGTASTFSRITKHKPEGFSRIFTGLRYLRDNAKNPEFRVGFNFVITKDNYREIPEVAKLGREFGAHYIRFEPEYYSGIGHKPIEEELETISDIINAVSSMSSGDYEISVPKLDRGPMDKTNKTEGNFKKCHYSKFVTALGADGYMYPCPQVHLNRRYRIGEAVQRGYGDWLVCGEREAWEKSNPLRTKLCKTCFYRPQNELLEWLSLKKCDLEETLKEYNREIPETLHRFFV